MQSIPKATSHDDIVAPTDEMANKLPFDITASDPITTKPVSIANKLIYILPKDVSVADLC